MAIRTAYVKKYIYVYTTSEYSSVIWLYPRILKLNKDNVIFFKRSSMSNGLKDDWVEHCSVNAQPCGWEAIVDAWDLQLFNLLPSIPVLFQSLPKTPNIASRRRVERFALYKLYIYIYTWFVKILYKCHFSESLFHFMIFLCGCSTSHWVAFYYLQHTTKIIKTQYLNEDTKIKPYPNIYLPFLHSSTSQSPPSGTTRGGERVHFCLNFWNWLRWKVQLPQLGWPQTSHLG